VIIICGIGGISTSYTFTAEEAAMAHRLLVSLTRRGTDAWGYFDGKTLYKESGSFLQSEKYYTLPDDLLEAKTNIFLCHTRLATQGDPGNNKNNHPFALDPFVFAHNGIIYKTDDFDNKWTIETDSFWLLYWIWYEYRKLNDVPQAIDAGVDHVRGTYACWLYNRKEKSVYLFRTLERLVGTNYDVGKERLVFGSDWKAIADAYKLYTYKWASKLFPRLRPTFLRTEPCVIYKIKDGVIEEIGRFIPIEPIEYDLELLQRKHGHLLVYHPD
jgi:glucosamine 6-phosphate synthetase-like amidotransferase/phosphosugar isomerase protein